MSPPRPTWARVLDDADSETADMILRLHLEDIEAAEAGQDLDSDSESDNADNSDDSSGPDTDDRSPNVEDLQAHEEQDSDDKSVESDQDESTDDDVDAASDQESRDDRSLRTLVIYGEIIVDELDRLEMNSDASSMRSSSPSVGQHEDDEPTDDDGDWEIEDNESAHHDEHDESDSEEGDREDEQQINGSSSESEDLSDNVSETSSLADYAGRNADEDHTCIICGDTRDRDGFCLLTCGHYHCAGCLNHAFRLSMRDRSSYPPRCCGPDAIPFVQVRRILKPRLADAFEQKQEELDDPHPTYCFKSTCSSYIPESLKEGAMGTCRECFSEICVLCRQEWHSGDCRNDEQTEQTLRLAKEMDWRKCPGCQRIVELTFGCNHVTCLCGKQFCYLCCAVWRSCDCERFTERRLTANGVRIE